jgi:hypothetical protein
LESVVLTFTAWPEVCLQLGDGKAAERISNHDRLGWRQTSTRKVKQKGNKKETIMKHYLPVFTALATSLMSSPFIPSLKASDVDKNTTITISQPVAVEGTVLPAGQYELTLQRDQSTTNIVRIFNGDGKLMTTVLAIHAYRLQPTGDTELKFYDSAAGQPTALHTWFYPGESSGFEFRQPKKAAVPVSVEAGG